MNTKKRNPFAGSYFGAAPLRVHPALITLATTILGLTPLAQNLGEGGDILQPGAITAFALKPLPDGLHSGKGLQNNWRNTKIPQI